MGSCTSRDLKKMINDRERHSSEQGSMLEGPMPGKNATCPITRPVRVSGALRGKERRLKKDGIRWPRTGEVPQCVDHSLLKGQATKEIKLQNDMILSIQTKYDTEPVAQRGSINSEGHLNKQTQARFPKRWKVLDHRT